MPIDKSQVSITSIITIAVIVTLNGCTSTVSKEEINKEVQTQVPVTPAHWTGQSESVAAAKESHIPWIELFNDPTLVALVEEALLHNKNLQAAAFNVERSLALATQAGAALEPSVSLVAGASRSGVQESAAPEMDKRNLGLQLKWELDVWGRIGAGRQAAQASAEAVAADYQFAQHSLASATIKAYLMAIEAHLQANVVRESLTALQETMHIVDVRYQNGLASAQDVALTRSDLAAAHERLITIEGSQRNAVRALEMLLGRYPSAELSVRKSLPAIPPLPPVGVPSELLERRPDMVAAERRVAAAFNLVRQAKVAQLPALSLTSAAGGASNSLSTLLDPVNVAWQLGANLLAPIFDGGLRKAQVSISTAEQKQALAAYGQAALGAFMETETYLDQGLVLSSREHDLKEALLEANEAYRIAKLRHQEGETDLLSVLTIQQRVISANSSLISVQRLLLEQRVNLHLALGGSWMSE